MQGRLSPPGSGVLMDAGDRDSIVRRGGCGWTRGADSSVDGGRQEGRVHEPRVPSTADPATGFGRPSLGAPGKSPPCRHPGFALPLEHPREATSCRPPSHEEQTPFQEGKGPGSAPWQRGLPGDILGAGNAESRQDTAWMSLVRPRGGASAGGERVGESNASGEASPPGTAQSGRAEGVRAEPCSPAGPWRTRA